MKRLIVIHALLFLSTALYAQGIKKLNVTELESYINTSDHPLIINFWASFCRPCITEIPYLQSITAKYKEKHLELLLVSLDPPGNYPEKIMAFAREKNITVAIAWLNENNTDYFCRKIDKKWTGGIPATLFVNNQTRYHLFFDRQLTGPQVELNVLALLKE